MEKSVTSDVLYVFQRLMILIIETSKFVYLGSSSHPPKWQWLTTMQCVRASFGRNQIVAKVAHGRITKWTFKRWVDEGWDISSKFASEHIMYVLKVLAQTSLVYFNKSKIISSWISEQKFVYCQLRFIDFKLFSLRCIN